MLALCNIVKSDRLASQTYFLQIISWDLMELPVGQKNHYIGLRLTKFTCRMLQSIIHQSDVRYTNVTFIDVEAEFINYASVIREKTGIQEGVTESMGYVTIHRRARV